MAQSCRLKDINELFYDTGIGKEGYSIIGQGQIDKILSGKPEDRRELFDEAAGIVKFKRRKSAAQKQLEEERQSLVRVNDIIAELEKQIGPLEKQSETAKVYLQKKEELKLYDVNGFLMETQENRRTVKGSGGKAGHRVRTSWRKRSSRWKRQSRTMRCWRPQIEALSGQMEEARSKASEAALAKQQSGKPDRAFKRTDQHGESQR